MKTILVPLDGSALAEQALPYARLLAPILSAKIHLLYVVSEADRDNLLVYDTELLEELSDGPETEPEPDQNSWEISRRQAEEYLVSQAAPLRDAGLDTDVAVRLGFPAQIIVECAESLPAALIVMATHGYSGLQRWTFGSVADEVVHATSIPVFIVRDTPPSPRDVALKRIMVPLDGTAFAGQALPFAVELALGAQAELILLQAAAPSIEEYLRAAPVHADLRVGLRDQAVQELAARAGGPGEQPVSIKTDVAIGQPAEVIVDEVDRQHVDLIVMATHGYSGLRRWARGSVADKVLHAATTPLVLVHGQALRA
jgi:nucleotide-binding universal stress UspA family protein